jgi:5-bromo-4-chloroindolyl phosphate hydrolysis protein
MNKEVKKAIKTLKTFLGMETKLEDMPLADGMTTIQADMFEVGEAVFIVVENADPVFQEILDTFFFGHLDQMTLNFTKKLIYLKSCTLHD